MAARLDPFVEVMLRERADQLYLLPDEPVTLVKDGKPRRVSKQPLTDQHIYAMVVEVAPPEAADKIDHQSETEFEYAAGQGLVRVRIVPEAGRLTAVISAIRRASQERVELVEAKTPPPHVLRLRRNRRHRRARPRSRPRPWSSHRPERPCRANSRPPSTRGPNSALANSSAPSSSPKAPTCTFGLASLPCSGPMARSGARRARRG